MRLAFVTTQRSYSIEIGTGRALDLLDSESYVTNQAAFEPGAQTLCEKLESIPGVRDVEYDGHFGPHVFLTIEDEHDSNAAKAQIAEVIEGHLKWCAQLTKDPRVAAGRASQLSSPSQGTSTP